MRRMNYAALASLAGLLAFSTGLHAQKNELTILHVNDTHSHIDPVRGGVDDGKGGVIERAAFIDEVRRQEGEKNVLLLHGGDFDQGTSYFTVLKGDMEVSVMNDLAYDATSFGNHEFDNGLDELARRLKNLKVPVVCANYDFENTVIGTYVKPYVVLERAGMKIGVIGALTDVRTVVDKDIADKLRYIDPASCINPIAARLRNSCDLVIVLSHLGFTEDCELAEQTRDVDLVIGGHSHTVLKSKAEVRNADGKKVTVVQDGCWGLEVGVLKYRK